MTAVGNGTSEVVKRIRMLIQWSPRSMPRIRRNAALWLSQMTAT